MHKSVKYSIQQQNYNFKQLKIDEEVTMACNQIMNSKKK